MFPFCEVLLHVLPYVHFAPLGQTYLDLLYPSRHRDSLQLPWQWIYVDQWFELWGLLIAP